MALVFADRVQETTATTGTGTITLAGAVAGFQSFSAIGNGNTTYYTIVSGTAWETGIGTYTSAGTTLSRDTVFESSNAGSKITLAGISNVFVTAPSDRAVLRDASNILTLPAGTATVPPLDFTAGTNLTTASAGAMEYDGTVGYFTPIGTQRGVLPGMQFYRRNTTLAGANATGAQNVLGVGCTLSASTVYCFELSFTIAKTAGTTSHTLAYGFGGTATINNAIVNVIRVGVNGTFPFVPVTVQNYGSQSNNTTAVTTVTGAITSANFVEIALVKGTVSINAGGTFIPQYSLSAAPGGAYTTQIGSYMLIYPIGTAGANTSVGTWA